ncbi:alpha/beta hydrolase [Aurantivibrio plasticivorans]
MNLAPVELSIINLGGMQMRVASEGTNQKGTILLIHGWPECWYSWRQQIQYFAQAGYRVIAPDMPGFGMSQPFTSVEDYHCDNVADVILALLDFYQIRNCHLVGHDFGASHAWQLALRFPEMFQTLTALSVPLHPHTKEPPMSLLRRHYEDDFYYQLYFQAQGLAEREFEERTRELLKALYCSPDTPRKAPLITSAKASAGGWIDRQGAPLELPKWITIADIDYYEAQYNASGFEGGINYYRNIDRNWEMMAPYKDVQLAMPVMFMAGEKDPVIKGRSEQQLSEMMSGRVPNLSINLLPDIGHWIQQEAGEEVNLALLGFLEAN